jgi:hypothetical protein
VRRVGFCLLVLAIAATSAFADSKTVRDDQEPRALDADRPPRPGRAEPSELAQTDFQRLRAEHIARLRGWTPGKPFDFTARSRAIRRMEAQEERRNRVRANQLGIAPLAAFPTWTNLGPNPIPNGQTEPINPVSGRVSAIEIDPTDPNKVYVGAAQGGVYRSLDGGATWTPIMDNALSLAIGALALDTTRGCLYVGTGESSAAIDSFGGVGIYRIDNVNTNPVLVGPINPIRNYTDSNGPESVPIFNGSGISKILLVPNDPTKMFVSTVFYAAIGIGADYSFGQIIPPHSISGLYRLTGVNGDPASVSPTKVKVTNLGTCFDTPCTGSLDIDDIAFDPGDATGNTLFAWQHGNKFAPQMGGVYRSTNAMAATPAFTQTFLTTAGSATNGRGVFQIYKQGANPAVVYIATGEPGSGTTCNGGNGAVRVSTDGGLTFSSKLLGGGGFCATQCNYDIGLAVNPGATTAASDDIIYLGGSFHDDSGCSLLAAKSVDGGATFAESNGGVHADNHAIKIAPSNSNIIYRGDDGGIWKSTNAGVDWTSLNNSTFIATQFQSIAVHPTDPNFSIGGTQDNGTENLLGNLTWNQIDFGDGGFALIDANATNTTNVTMYHTFYNLKADTIGYVQVDLVSDATDGNWTYSGCFDGSTAANGIPCTDETEFYAPMALGPGTPNIVYFGTDRLYRSINKGVNNTVVSQAPLVSGGAAISSIAIALQHDPYRIVGASDGSLFYTVTGSSTLTVLDPVGTGSVIPDQYVGRIVFDPTDQHIAYIAVEGYMGDTTSAHSHLWKVSTLGSSPVLNPINGSGNTGLPDVPINGIAVDITKPSRIFVGTDIGVFDSEDGGATWSPFGLGLPRVAVFDMAIQNVKRVLRIATHGRGMYEIDLPAAATTIINPPSHVVANATTTTNVHLTWSSAGTSMTYQIWRSNNNGAYAQVGTTMGTSYDDPVSADITYLYKIKSVDGAANISPFSDMDFATTVIFNDEPLAAGTAVKAVHLTQLRTAVNAMQRSAGVTVTSFTDSTVNNSLLIKGVHISELRTGLNAARAAIGAIQLLFANPALVGGFIKAIDFQELRDGVK